MIRFEFRNFSITVSYRDFKPKTSVFLQSGQGLVEYLLLLVLTVGLVMAVSRGIGRPLQRYMEDNVFSLVRCMLRVGDYPHRSFGACQGGAAPQFSLNPNGAAGGDGSAGNGNASSDSNSPEGEAGGSSADQSENASAGSRVRSRSRRGSLDGGSGYGNNLTEPEPFKISTKKENGPGEVRIETESDGGAFGRAGDLTIVKIKNPDDEGRIGGSFNVQGDEKEDSTDSLAAKAKEASKKLPEEELEQDRQLSSSIPLQDRNRKPTSYTKTEKEPWSFFGLLKWVIIIGIFVIFLVFLGAQLNSIRKGWTDS